MDPFTEKLLERTRARRENLQKKMASRPTAAAAASSSSNNKRAREPLADTNSVLSDTHVVTTPQPSSKPSPSKRSRSGEITAPPPPVGEENREPPVPAATLPDPRTDRKPPVGPASVRSSSSLEKKSAMTRPVVQAPPPEQTVTRPVVQAPPPEQTMTRPVVQAPPVQPEPERMVERSAPEPQRSEEPQRAERRPAPDEPEAHVTTVPAAAGRTRVVVQPDREAVPKEAPPPATGGGGGMKSRLQRLADKRHCWDGNGDDADDLPDGPPPSPLKRREEACVAPAVPPSSSSSSSDSAPMGRRGRLANLAATIGSWEDDLSHPATQRQQDNEQEKPGTAWAAKMAARDAAAAAASKQPAATKQQPAAAAAAQRVLASQPASSSNNKTPATSSIQPIVDSPVKASRVVLPSAQQATVPSAVRGPVAHTGRGQASPQKASNQGPSYPASPQKASNQGVSYPASPQKASNQGVSYPASPQKASNQGVSYPASPQKASNQGVSYPASPQKASNQGVSYPASPQKAVPSSAPPVVISQSPRKDRGLDFTFSGSKKPELGAKPLTASGPAGPSAPQSRDHPATPLQHKATPGPTGVKSFVERFGERCQERSNHSSPATAAAAGSAQAASRTPAGTPSSSSSVSPSTRLVQDRLRAAQGASTATADLTQRQKLERESELAQIRTRFQKGSGNMWKNKEDETEATVPKKHPEETPAAPKKTPQIKVVESVSCDTDRSVSVDDDFSSTSNLTCATEPFSTASNYSSAGHLLVVSPPAATSSPLRRLDLLVEEEKKKPSSSFSCSSEEVEMSVDQSINSAVINGLFEGVYDEEEEDDEEEEEDALNISSMSLLAPLEETVAAVVRSPERRLMTSTPACSFNEKSQTPDCESRPSKFQRARVTRGGSTDGLDEKLPYSVDAYRSIKKKDVDRPDVKQVIVRKEDVSQRLDEPRATSAASIKQRMKILSNEMNLQQTIIHQASQALNCCTDEEHGKGSPVEAEAERLLLVATERRAAVKAELEQLKGQGSGSAAAAAAAGSSSSKAQEEMGVSATKGSISLLELRLPLKADFVCSSAASANKPESANHYFFLMIRAGAVNTVATPMASTRSALSGDALTFTTKFTMSDVSSDFEIDIEVYYLVQKRELFNDKRKKPSKSKIGWSGILDGHDVLMSAITPKRFLAITKTSQTPVLASPGGPNSVRTSNFSLVGSHKLTLASIGKNKFPLTKVPFLCPMEGHICLKMQCQVGCTVEEKGFLTMFEDVSGFGAWHRRWCVLSGYCISYWTYPDDERRKKPMGRLNLANCTSRKVEPANREFCARPNTFELVTVRPQRDEDKETLVSQCKNTMCVTKNWLCADTKDERNLWMQKLNQVLVDLRMWQPDSCYRPQ